MAIQDTRFLLSLSKKQLADVHWASRRLKISSAELFRRAATQYILEHPPKHPVPPNPFPPEL